MTNRRIKQQFPSIFRGDRLRRAHQEKTNPFGNMTNRRIKQQFPSIFRGDRLRRAHQEKTNPLPPLYTPVPSAIKRQPHFPGHFSKTKDESLIPSHRLPPSALLSSGSETG
ncbi:hypothetical protein QE152_g27216 [Popillia japonica]|uniref:Uncharacterized protein n=1 Tax=Popillia japonica TaxID=7064 RepID=A0AAW1JU03_POPJA